MKTRSLKSKLLSSYALIAIITILVGASGFWGIHTTSGHRDQVDEIAEKQIHLLNFKIDVKDLALAVGTVVRAHASDADIEKLRERVAHITQRHQEKAKLYEKLKFAQNEQPLWVKSEETFHSLEGMAEQMIRLSATGNSADQKARDDLATGGFADTSSHARDAITAVVDLNVSEAKVFSEQARSAGNLANILSLIVMAAGTAISIIFGLKISSSLATTLNGIVATLTDNSAQVGGAAQQVASASQQLSQATTEQAASVEETSSSVEEMSSMIKKCSENADRAAEVSDTTQASATKGKVVVGEMLKAIADINESNTQISEIVKVIGEIEDKTKVINDIVFKTQLLSFNASVEAARAGVHGKGFAVVAEEVGKLAQLSGNAAQEISGMLSKSILRVEGLVTSAKEKVKIGTDIAQQCGVVLDDLVGNVGTLNSMAKEIAKASEEQAQGVDQVSKAMVQVDQITQQNAATAEESSSAAEELSSQAEALNSVVQTLVETINGSDGQRTHLTGASVSASGFRGSAQKGGSNGPSKVIHFKNQSSKKSQLDYSGNTQGVGFRKTESDDSISDTDPRFKDV